jgi:hypothetical protein
VFYQNLMYARGIRDARVKQMTPKVML